MFWFLQHRATVLTEAVSPCASDNHFTACLRVAVLMSKRKCYLPLIQGVSNRLAGRLALEAGELCLIQGVTVRLCILSCNEYL